MKRIISVFIIVAMMLASVLALIPTSALESTAASTNARMTYNVNWKELVEDGTMRAQWLYDRKPTFNDMPNRYVITATDTALTLNLHTEEGMDLDGDHRQYYSELMFNLTSDTHYIYEFEARANGYYDGGVIFAFANNPKARDETDSKTDIYGNKIEDKIATYILRGNLNTGSAEIKFGGAWANYGYEDSKNVEQSVIDASIVDGYTKYKVVYIGLNVEFFYLDRYGEWVELYADETITLAEGAKLAFGLYTWTPDWVDVKNCVVYAMNDAAAFNMNSAINTPIVQPADWTALDAAVARGASIVASEYTPITYDHFKAVLDAAIALRATYNVSQNEVDNATALLNEALSLLVKRADKSVLEAAIAEGMGLKKIEWCGNAIAWTMFERALSDAAAILADENATQEEVDEMVYILQQRKDNLIRNPGYSDPYLESEKEKIISALGTKKDNSRNTYSQSSYSKYVNAYNSIVSSINSASTLAELEAIDVKALKNSAEALLVLAVDDLPSLREIAFKFMGKKIVNENGKFTIDSYAEYVSAYDSIIKQINMAKDVDSLKALDLRGLKAWAESMLVATDTDEYETENDGYISDKIPEKGEHIIATDKNYNNDNDYDYDYDYDGDRVGGNGGGCLSSIGISVLAVIGVIGSALLVKKKEN